MVLYGEFGRMLMDLVFASKVGCGCGGRFWWESLRKCGEVVMGWRSYHMIGEESQNSQAAELKSYVTVENESASSE
jgi:hypothetical protein